MKKRMWGEFKQGVQNVCMHSWMYVWMHTTFYFYFFIITFTPQLYSHTEVGGFAPSNLLG